jgi:hypothetical protein
LKALEAPEEQKWDKFELSADEGSWAKFDFGKSRRSATVRCKFILRSSLSPTIAARGKKKQRKRKRAGEVKRRRRRKVDIESLVSSASAGELCSGLRAIVGRR